MKVKENFLKIVSVFLLVVLVPVLFVGCKEEEESPLEFSTISSFLLDFDSAVRPFLSTLELNYQASEDAEILTSSASSIKTISYEMGESFKAFGNFLSELENNTVDGATVERTSESIKIKTTEVEFWAKFSPKDGCMSVSSTSDGESNIIEVTKRLDGGYYAQFVTKTSGIDSYVVYQLSFLGTTGNFNLDMASSNYISIYKAEITAGVFPNVTAKQFSN